jgi:hypothetical protein
MVFGQGAERTNQVGPGGCIKHGTFWPYRPGPSMRYRAFAEGLTFASGRGWKHAVELETEIIAPRLSLFAQTHVLPKLPMYYFRLSPWGT